MCATCSAQGSGRWEGDAQDCRDLIAAPRGVTESGRSRGNARRSLHSVFFAKVDSMLRFRGLILNATQRSTALRTRWRQLSRPRSESEGDRSWHRLLKRSGKRMVYEASLQVVDAYRGYLSSWVPQVLCEPGCSSGLCPGTCAVPSRSVSSDLDTLTPKFELYVRLRERRQWDSDSCCVVSLARLRPVRGRRTRVKHVTGLTGLDEAFHHSWYQSKAVVMADRRNWGGGGDDPEESTQRMIERIWESLIRTRMDQQAPVPPVTREVVPVAPVPPPPGVEVPFVAPVPLSPPVIAAEEPVVQIERFLRLQPPTYTGGPNPDTVSTGFMRLRGSL
ncbi:hypothetical protein Taro_008706 [Colocasia esculenta]|uniref:Uncharacterized protein n=1 Tax=Colocasia esculenta TaxID=4460 RepID=A0A843U3S2_COLES|nr:hypothetical protein [Colocasia esculenta]